MDRLFYPRSVVVIGVSESPDNLARIIYENLIEFQFQGEIFLVGRKEATLHGRKVFTSLEPLKEGIDVAVILTPAPTVLGFVEACGRKKIPWVIIETGGFREYSDEAFKVEAEFLRLANTRDFRIVGPNCIGIVNPEHGFAVPFVSLKRSMIDQGGVSILTQSGGVSFSFYRFLATTNVGIAKLVSMGNKLDLDEIDYLRYLIQDPRTEVIGLYLESLVKGKELMEVARSTQKPIIVHKANTAEGSREIARLHTAALANDDQVVDAALKQAGIIRTRNFRSFANIVKVLSLPPMKGNNLVVLSRSGGMAIVAADSAGSYGFRLFPLSQTFQDQIHGFFRAKVIRPTNPVDLGDLFDFDLYTKILDYVLRIEGVDGILFQHGASAEEREPSRRLVHAMRDLCHQFDKPVAFCYFTDDEELGVIKKAVNFPVFMEPDDALAALAVSRDYYRKKNTPREDPIAFPADRDRVRRLVQKAIEEERDPVLPEALAVLKAYGIPVARSSIVQRQDDLKSALQKIRKPMALKVISPAISHKSDVGGVALNLRSFTETRKALKALEGLDPEPSFGFLAQEMISDGIEVILGAKRDPSFGPVILFGLGGIYTEIFKEASMGVAPISRAEAKEMILESRASGILKGARGRKPADIDAVVDNLLRLSQLMLDFPKIEGIDINPLMVGEKGTVAVDARIELRRNNEQTS